VMRAVDSDKHPAMLLKFFLDDGKADRTWHESLR
jgi:hypothetical protein